MEFILTFIITWLFLCTLVAFAPDEIRKPVRALLAIAFFATLILVATKISSVERLIATTGGMLYVFKTIILLQHSRTEIASFHPLGLALYMTVWPGMNPKPFAARTLTTETGDRFSQGAIFFMCGFLLTLFISIMLPTLPPYATPWFGLIAIMSMVHFGYSEMLTTFVRLAGFDVQPLFRDPLKATSLADFWSKRWNLAFVEMDKILFLKPLRRVLSASQAIFAIFLISGILHELAISYPAFTNWGTPFVYFVIQGVAVTVEAKVLKPHLQNVFLGRVWTYLCILAPLPLLFSPSFQTAFITPLFETAHGFITSKTLRDWLSLGLWCAAAGNFVTICAGSQVPFRLNWKDEFAKLTPFTRKIIWTYYAYTGAMILTWGVVTILLHEQLLNGEKTALIFALIIGCFWSARVLIDIFSFGHKGWPTGADMRIGHALLFFLFCALAATYLTVVALNWTTLIS